MCTSAVFFNGSEAMYVANDGAELRYHANIEYLPPYYEAEARPSAERELLYIIERGTIEFMVDGHSVFVSDGDVVRIKPAAFYSYRNPSPRPARLLVRTMRPNERK